MKLGIFATLLVFLLSCGESDEKNGKINTDITFADNSDTVLQADNSKKNKTTYTFDLIGLENEENYNVLYRIGTLNAFQSGELFLPQKVGKVSSGSFSFQGPEYKLLEDNLYVEINLSKTLTANSYLDYRLFLPFQNEKQYQVFRRSAFEKLITNHTILIDGKKKDENKTDDTGWSSDENFGKDFKGRELFFTFDSDSLFWAFSKYDLTKFPSEELRIYLDFDFSLSGPNATHHKAAIGDSKPEPRLFPTGSSCIEDKDGLRKTGFCPDLLVVISSDSINDKITFYKPASDRRTWSLFEPAEDIIQRNKINLGEVNQTEKFNEVAISRELLKAEEKKAEKVKWLVLSHDRLDDRNYGFWPYNYPGYGNLFPGAETAQNTLGYTDEYYETRLSPSTRLDKEPKKSR